MRRDRQNNLLKLLVGAGLYLLDPLREQLIDRVEDVRERAEETYEAARDRVGAMADRLRGRSGWDNALWMLLGVGVGVGVGMLLAPASGEETRRDIADKVREVGDKARGRFSPAEPRSASGTYGE